MCSLFSMLVSFSCFDANNITDRSRGPKKNLMDMIKRMTSYKNTSSHPDDDESLSIINPLSPHFLITSRLINY